MYGFIEIGLFMKSKLRSYIELVCFQFSTCQWCLIFY